jgi:DNA-binding GntR family transcriptional regulator
MPSRPPSRTRSRPNKATPAPRMSDLVGNFQGGPEEPAAQSPFSKAGHAYTVLRREILDGVHSPGAWLRLSAIADRLGLSAMPIREALRLLEKDGLVVMHLHRGAQVASLSFELALELTEVRMQLERYAALIAAPENTAETLAEAERALHALEAMADDPVQFALGNRSFASAVLEACPNDFLKRHIQRLWDQTWQHSSTAVFEVMRHRIVDSLEENTTILHRMRGQDLPGLGEIYDLRLRKSLDAWRKAIERTQRAVPAAP